MVIKKKKPWQIPEREATPEDIYLSRRQFIKKAGIYSLSAGVFMSGANGLFDIFKKPDEERILRLPKTPTSALYPAKRNPAYAPGRPLTDELVAAKYNNFYEFSSFKSVWKHVDRLEPRPWQVEIAGLVEKPRIYDIDELVRSMPLEERLYRFRCVEAWAMTVPWTGFPMKELIKKVSPLSSAKYVSLQTFYNKDWAGQQKIRFWLPWPYVEGLTMEEATNELTFLATGIYGHELPKQHGAPIRLVTPWKYGFKSIKSIVRIEFTSVQPKTFWNTLVPDEYDFRANVNPEVPHPRWSQETERIIDTDERVPTVKYNGYGDYVAGLYKGLATST
ncbi:MAG: protein-methionine-sulfoxide reductase catalytic subunit MsrP [Deltaproteobacteria bacterium]|nr:protein-methionine-sulfoxide reductase catalytic subunit MsrP [Deltaproteobacteria bacterium]